MITFDTSQRISAASGMVLIVLMQVDGDEVVKTVILEGIGGISSYLVTLTVKYLIHFFRRKW